MAIGIVPPIEKGIPRTILSMYYIQILKSLTLKMKIKDVEDFDENWLAIASFQHVLCVQKLALLGPTVSS